MASTITVQDLINYARTHIKLAPLDGLGGFTSEPALKWANKIKKRIIRRKYNWEWNRKTMPSFLTVDGRDEYPALTTDIGWIEDAMAEQEASTSNPKYNYYLDVRRKLRKGWEKNDPCQIAYMLDRYRQPIFRLDKVASSTIWRIYIDYQMKPKKMTALSGAGGLFDPIPDEMEDVLTQFFIAFAYKLVDRADHMRELAEAERLLEEFVDAEKNEQDDVGFVPERGMLLG